MYLVILSLVFILRWATYLVSFGSLYVVEAHLGVARFGAWGILEEYEGHCTMVFCPLVVVLIWRGICTVRYDWVSG